MLPIAVLPIAGLLLRLGHPDMLNIAFVAAAGNAVFNNLPIIFALGVSVGFAKESHGAAAIAAYIGYVVMVSAMGVINPDLKMDVFGGIIIGVTAGTLYNKFKDLSLPSYLAFFGGRRFIPIITGFVAIIYAFIFSYIWPYAQGFISQLGRLIIESGNIGLFLWGVANRLLLPLGLHHILNNFIYFQFGDYTTMEAGVEVIKHGDLWRFFAKDPTAGSFMAGFFPVMMFGLPAAALAMITEAHKQNRKVVAGILFSAALTSLLTGITEPIEFAFMFLAFPLYIIHAVLSGVSMVIMNLLDVKIGYTFSAGLFDYILNYNIGKNAILVLSVGLCYGLLYYFLFRFVIRTWNIKTPGREDTYENIMETAPKFEETPVLNYSRGEKYLKFLGGAENIKTLEACATRLRVEIYDNSKIDKASLKDAGAKGVLNNIKGSAQIVIGPEADIIADEVKAAMK
jgi:PTS system N-acetylglucosamine-specific IIC component